MKSLIPYLALGALLWLAVLKSGVHATIAGVLLALTVPIAGPVDRDHGPLVRLEHALHPWVSWAVLPVFALANAGVALGGGSVDLLHPVTLGVAVGTLVGKSVGIPAMAWLAVRSGLAVLPAGTGWPHVVGVGLLGGIGFTMRIFVGGLAFADPALLDAAKVGILLGSLLAGLSGMGLLWVAGRGTSSQEERREEGEAARAAA